MGSRTFSTVTHGLPGHPGHMETEQQIRVPGPFTAPRRGKRRADRFSHLASLPATGQLNLGHQAVVVL
jgi:hypothetical protein